MCLGICILHETPKTTISNKPARKNKIFHWRRNREAIAYTSPVILLEEAGNFVKYLHEAWLRAFTNNLFTDIALSRGHLRYFSLSLLWLHHPPIQCSPSSSSDFSLASSAEFPP